jgi:hypothetical protein
LVLCRGSSWKRAATHPRLTAMLCSSLSSTDFTTRRGRSSADWRESRERCGAFVRIAASGARGPRGATAAWQPPACMGSFPAFQC